jgi:hypothetical protein
VVTLEDGQGSSQPRNNKIVFDNLTSGDPTFKQGLYNPGFADFNFAVDNKSSYRCLGIANIASSAPLKASADVIKPSDFTWGNGDSNMEGGLNAEDMMFNWRVFE